MIHEITLTSGRFNGLDDESPTTPVIAKSYRWRCSCGAASDWTFTTEAAARVDHARHSQEDK